MVYLRNSLKNNLRVSDSIEKQSKPRILGVQGEPPPGAPRVGAAGGTTIIDEIIELECVVLGRGRFCRVNPAWVGWLRK